jgi:hypothetical protein
MPVFDRFVAARKEAVPAAYLVPSRLLEVVELLRRQGVQVEVIGKPGRTSVETFNLDSLSVGPVFEGHRTVEAQGGWSREPVDTVVNSGWFLVSTDQPLGILAAYLLEPRSEDGVVTWNLLDRELQAGTAYPILRIRAAARIPAVAVP